jgi:hypothetical protein
VARRKVRVVAQLPVGHTAASATPLVNPFWWTWARVAFRFRAARSIGGRRRTPLPAVLIDEPSVEETIEIVDGLRDRYEAYHRVRISPEALVAAAELSDRYITDRFLPDKAIDVVIGILIRPSDPLENVSPGAEPLTTSLGPAERRTV